MAKQSSSAPKKLFIGSRARVTRARSRVKSPSPASSGVSESRADGSSLRSITKSSKAPGYLLPKSDWKKQSKAIHAKCFDEMDKIGRELQLALAEKTDQKAYESQLLQRIQAIKAEGRSKLQQAIALKETALAENERLQNEIRQLQQQVELLNASTQDNIPWNDVQPILHQTHGELVSATTRYWNAIDALQNRRLASYLPGSGVIHGNWTEQCVPLGSLGHDSLPGLAESGNPSSNIQQKPGANNVFDSFV
ncbi:hypothetical protein N7520_001695 [Penicillium odoratum]|uniref:uncharacterized protein n=1 Tax=Penicillium odoratum TaxID=1167516 RepID=UPI0025479DFE|nr:uncharacterized protein N7520_001695 [Penicillium odoratum]KAJ5778449.1 hypothetical protein N7520_001695 [Penicillium odoratum]